MKLYELMEMLENMKAAGEEVMEAEVMIDIGGGKLRNLTDDYEFRWIEKDETAP